MKKKIVSIAVVLALMMTAALTGCSKAEKYSETYQGTVSEETYADRNEAAAAFIDLEISGAAVEATFVSCESEGELNEKQVAELNIDAKYQENLEKVERVKVAYTESLSEDDYDYDNDWDDDDYGYGSLNAAATAAEDEPTVVTKYRIVFVLVYVNGECRFFAPVVTKGEQLTSSYFASVFAPENYYNCTIKEDATVKTSAMGQSSKVNLTMNLKCTETAFYLQEDQMGIDIEMYMMENNDKISAAVKTTFGPTKTDWEVNNDIFGSMIGSGAADLEITKLTDYLQTLFEQLFGDMDHTFFEKTSTGYSLRKGLGKQFLIAQIKSSMGGESGSGALIGQINNMFNDFDMDYDIYIRDGKVARLELSFDTVMNQSGFSISLSEECTVKFSDFGTTKVNVPADVMALFA